MLNEQERIDIVRYRINNATATLREVDDLCRLGYYNNAANRLYYACYYAVSALLVANQISTKSHAGVRQMLNLHFIKTGILPTYFGSYYNELFNSRLTGDYEDLFNHTEQTIARLRPKAEELVGAVRGLVKTWLDSNNANNPSL